MLRIELTKLVFLSTLRAREEPELQYVPTRPTPEDEAPQTVQEQRLQEIYLHQGATPKQQGMKSLNASPESAARSPEATE